MNDNRKIRFKLVLLLGLFLSFFVTFGRVESVMAGQVSTIYESVNKKGRYQGIYNCYQTTKDGKYVIDGKIELSEYAGMVSLFYRPLGVNTAGPGAKVKMPLAKRENINCEALLNKYKSKAPASSSGKDKIEEFLGNMGYSMDSNAQSGSCYYLSFKYNGKKKTSNRVCQENGRTWTGGDPKYEQAGFWWQNGEASGVICLTLLNGKGESQINNSRCINLRESEKNSKLSAKKIINKLVSDYNICSGGKCTREKIDNKITNLETKGPEAASNGVVAKLTKAKRSKGGEKAIATLSGNKETKKSVAIGSLEKRLLYQAYLHSYYGTTISCKNDDYMDGEIQWYKWANGEKKTQKCWYNKDEHNANVSANKKVHAVNEKGWFEGEIGIDELIKELQKKGSYSDSEVKEMQELLKNGGVTDETDDNSNGDPCLSEGKGFGLNWIICRVIDITSGAANDVYNKAVEPFLAIKSTKLFDNEGREGVTQAWEQFRDFANIIFVILLLVVIFSQLTGVGITNYGIKKILPRLIVLAVMINLSYFLCVLAVDLSNILGNGFQALLQNMSNNLNTSNFTYDGTKLSVVAVGTGLAGLGLLTGVVGAGVLFADVGLLLSLLVTAVGVAISIFFLFILLSVRQAAIVVLVVISPLAVVMYALPNTKKVFDRWLKLFEGLLLVYPIAGLLVGAGDFVSRLMVVAGLATGFGIFVAIIVSVAPIFFIPTVLKQSFAAFGSVGSKLAGLGQTMSGGATKKIRDNEGYQMMRTKMAAGRPGGIRQKVMSKMPGVLGRNMMARNMMKYDKMMREQGNYDAMFGKDYFLKTEADNKMKEIVADGTINDSGELQRKLQEAMVKGDRASIVAYSDALSAKGKDGRQKVVDAYNTVAKSGKMNDTSASTFANNLLSNHASEYKNNERTMYEIAKNINEHPKTSGEHAVTTEDYLKDEVALNKIQMSAASSNLGSMDDDEFNRTIDKIDVSKLDDDQLQAFGSNIFNTLSNNSDMKSSRAAALNKKYEEIKNDGRYKPPQQHVVVDSGSTK
ncbi:hypothetical protein IKE97_01765 [Candidatus Saccharibacteria bacterium]|nr:hypothetical protein [Candidatus Saccharibacteria bacterium]